MKKTDLTSRERVMLAFDHKETDRIPKFETFWPDTLKQWRQEGSLKPDQDILELYDYDIIRVGINYYEARVGYMEVMEESDEWISKKDGNGAVLRYWKNKCGAPEHVAFTVDTRDKWEVLKKELLGTPIEQRVDLKAGLEGMRKAAAKNRWYCWAGLECFELVKNITGHETLCCVMAEDPDWAKDMFDTITDVAIRMMDYLEKNGLKLDGGWIYGDVAYNHGPFCSPRMYKQLVQPAHKRQLGWFRERNMPVIYHTDGDFRSLLPLLIESGVTCFQPLEAKARIDVCELKPKYGDQVSFMGNIDVMILLTNDREKIEAEVSRKIPVAKKDGGYVYHSDHSVPPGITWDTHQFLMELVGKYGRY